MFNVSSLFNFPFILVYVAVINNLLVFACNISCTCLCEICLILFMVHSIVSVMHLAFYCFKVLCGKGWQFEYKI